MLRSTGTGSQQWPHTSLNPCTAQSQSLPTNYHLLETFSTYKIVFGIILNCCVPGVLFRSKRHLKFVTWLNTHVSTKTCMTANNLILHKAVTAYMLVYTPTLYTHCIHLNVYTNIVHSLYTSYNIHITVHLTGHTLTRGSHNDIDDNK